MMNVSDTSKRRRLFAMFLRNLTTVQSYLYIRYKTDITPQLRWCPAALSCRGRLWLQWGVNSPLGG